MILLYTYVCIYALWYLSFFNLYYHYKSKFAEEKMPAVVYVHEMEYLIKIFTLNYANLIS